MKLLDGQCGVLWEENHLMLAQAPSAQPGEGRRPEGWAWPSVTAPSLSRHMASLATLSRLTTRPSTSVRTRSPISGEMSLPNCCRVVRNRLSLLSCRAPQAGGRCCVDSEAVDEVAGPLLKPLGVDGVPLMAVGEWLLPFITVGGEGSVRSTAESCRPLATATGIPRGYQHPLQMHRLGPERCVLDPGPQWVGSSQSDPPHPRDMP